MNEKQKLMTIGGLSAFVGFTITSRILDKRRERRRVEQTRLRAQSQLRFEKSTEALISDLDDRIVNAKYWLQVTEDM